MNPDKPLKPLSFEKPQIMGIINLTPDSFFDGGKHQALSGVIGDAAEKIKQGASIIDLGAVSTRPGAADVSEAEEMQRLLEPLKAIRKEFPDVLISVDTYRSAVAEACILEGADIINDISGGVLDEKIFEVVARYQVPYILMHMQGTPQTMQLTPHYEDVVIEVKAFFDKQIAKLKALGFNKIILDPGFGFGKNVEHNFQLLKSMPEFSALGFPVLAGLSRKSMINKVLHTKPESALNGTSVLNTIALLNGAAILRVHDVREARQCIELVQQYNLAK